MSTFAGIAGFQTERVSHELKWERTANLSGLQGHCIGLDLLNEFLVRDLKGIDHILSIQHTKNKCIILCKLFIYLKYQNIMGLVKIQYNFNDQIIGNSINIRDLQNFFTPCLSFPRHCQVTVLWRVCVLRVNV